MEDWVVPVDQEFEFDVHRLFTEDYLSHYNIQILDLEDEGFKPLKKVKTAIEQVEEVQEDISYQDFVIRGNVSEQGIFTYEVFFLTSPKEEIEDGEKEIWPKMVKAKVLITVEKPSKHQGHNGGVGDDPENLEGSRGPPFHIFAIIGVVVLAFVLIILRKCVCKKGKELNPKVPLPESPDIE